MKKRVKKEKQIIFARQIGKEAAFIQYPSALHLTVYCHCTNLWVCNNAQIVNIEDYLNAHKQEKMLYINLISTI